MARILVMASPRSGTRSVAELLRGSGLRVGHEKMLRDGTVSSLFAVDDFLYPGAHAHDRPSKHRFDEVVQLVRHPLLCIASLASMNRPHFWHWTQVHTKRSYEADGPLLYAAHFWAIWNEKIRAQMPQSVWKLELLKAAPHVGKSEHGSIGWRDLGTAEEAVRKEALHYGYED